MEAQPIVVAANNIPMGTRLDAGLITVRDWPKAGVPQGALSERDAAVGRLVKGEITRDEPILESRLFPKDVSGTPGIMSVMVPPGKRAMAVGVNEVIGVSGFILPKDRVDVIATRSDQSSKSSETILQNIEVLAAGKRLEQEGKQKRRGPHPDISREPARGGTPCPRFAARQDPYRPAIRYGQGQAGGASCGVCAGSVVRRKAGSRKTQADTKPEKKEGKMIEIEVIRGDKRTTETYPIETP